ncbi:uncharacterized protein VTP21DRAFT_11021 [Calcarisporiella thermophila]|uniref:uncharacterized protein n=1 Tax=Calcarisporiella thermophila TaxID=911321 RepID=UPI003743F701
MAFRSSSLRLFMSPLSYNQISSARAALRSQNPSILYLRSSLATSHKSGPSLQSRLFNSSSSFSALPVPKSATISSLCRNQIRTFHRDAREYYKDEWDKAWHHWHKRYSKQFGKDSAKWESADMPPYPPHYLYYRGWRPFYGYHRWGYYCHPRHRIAKLLLFVGVPIAYFASGSSAAMTVAAGGVALALIPSLFSAASFVVFTAFGIMFVTAVGGGFVFGVPMMEMKYRLEELIDDGFDSEKWTIHKSAKDLPNEMERWRVKWFDRHESKWESLITSGEVEMKGEKKQVRFSCDRKGDNIMQEKYLRVAAAVEEELAKREALGDMYPDKVYLRSNDAWMFHTVFPIKRSLAKSVRAEKAQSATQSGSSVIVAQNPQLLPSSNPNPAPVPQIQAQHTEVQPSLQPQLAVQSQGIQPNTQSQPGFPPQTYQ